MITKFLLSINIKNKSKMQIEKFSSVLKKYSKFKSIQFIIKKIRLNANLINIFNNNKKNCEL